MRRAVGLVLAAFLLVSCGGSGERPSGSSTRTPASVPSVTATVPSATRTPERADKSAATTSTSTEPETSRTTKTQTETETTGATKTETTRATETRKATQTETTTATRTASVVPSAATTASTQPTSAETGGAPTWLWWVLGAIVVALAVGIPLLIRSRRRQAWRDDLASGEDEVAWFARGLIPELRRQPSPEQAAGAWNVESSRVVTAEDKLTALERSAPDEAAGTRARTLRDAVRAARGDIENLLATATPITMPSDLDAVSARLEQALGQPRPEAATPPGPPGPR
ncbi:hypothetical protein OHA18_12435 [Kribbella sp. NBC_00709]|uniref:hypothetical protein n=1 Tax=Kribbella sp. NBC_00709 TaxID=2975972 RepID=UPI002E2CE98F|nr:hypothetical protein [Kribbella sp. NBC_00709]